MRIVLVCCSVRIKTHWWPHLKKKQKTKKANTTFLFFRYIERGGKSKHGLDFFEVGPNLVLPFKWHILRSQVNRSGYHRQIDLSIYYIFKFQYEGGTHPPSYWNPETEMNSWDFRAPSQRTVSSVRRSRRKKWVLFFDYDVIWIIMS